MNQEQIFTFKMNPAMLNVVLKGINELPHKESRTVYDEIVKQYNDQLRAVEVDLKERRAAALAKEKEEKEQLTN